MNKKIVGIVTAALLFGGSIGYAASSSLIGAKVQGLYVVQKVDGTRIADAVIINGSAYAPVRAISEATGTALSIEGKTIIMGDTVETSQAIGGSTQVEPMTETPITLTGAEKEILQRRITNMERTLTYTRDTLTQAEANLAASSDPAEKERLEKSIKEMQANLPTMQKALDADKARLAAGQ